MRKMMGYSSVIQMSIVGVMAMYVEERVMVWNMVVYGIG